jgi:triosephosphate isomerase
MNKKLIVGNLKMNPVSPAEFGRWLDGLEKETKGKKFEKTEIVVCPPAVYFRQFLERKFKNVKLGAQDAYWEYNGAYTGQISAAMAKAAGAQFSIVGHSERRKYFGEDEEIVNLKLKAILKCGMQAILCIGESADERKGNRTAAVLKRQLAGSFAGVGIGKAECVSIAYEPIWAVGTDKIPSSDEILEAKIVIKKTLAELYSRKAAEKMKILYGGSVKSHCAGSVCVEPAMDGALIGRESLVPYEFVKIAGIVDTN